MPPTDFPSALPLGVGRRAARRTLVHGVPAEHCTVERLGRIEIRRDQFAPAVGAGLVGHLGAGVLVGLPEPENRAQRVGEHHHPAGIHDVHGAGEDRAAVGGDLGCRVVGTVDIDIGHPHGWHARVHHRAQTRHRLAAQVADRIATGLRRSRWAVPPKERPVELSRSVQVGTAQVHPGRDPVVIALELHRASSWSACPGASTVPDRCHTRTGPG